MTSSINPTDGSLVPSNPAQADALALQAIEKGNQSTSTNSVTNSQTDSVSNQTDTSQTSTVPNTTSDDDTTTSSTRSFAGRARTMGKVLGGHSGVSDSGSAAAVADSASADYQNWLIQQQAIQYQQQEQDITNEQIQQNASKVNRI